jgi:aminoglycoside phosphotransferase (APT) family kinase protein
MNWHVPYSEYKGLGGLNLKALEIPTEGEYIAEYCRNSGREIISPAEWDFYMAYSFFRIAAISQGIKARAQDGNASNRRAVEYGARTPRYAQLDKQQMEKSLIRRN